MKAQSSEKFYFQYWDDMMERYGEDQRFYANLENQLVRALAVYKDLPEVAVKYVQRMEAENIAKRCKQRMIEMMVMIKRIISGESSLGYISKSQEISARHELIQGFEFTCLVLREFKKKYDITD